MKEIIRELEQLKEKMKREGSGELVKYFKDFLEAHPDVLGIVWDQYTPYFMDGDVCTFAVHEPRFKISPELLGKKGLLEGDENEMELSDPTDFSYEGTYESCSLQDIDPELQKQAEEMESDMESAEELLELVLGDHVTVTVTREGLTTEECNHD